MIVVFAFLQYTKNGPHVRANLWPVLGNLYPVLWTTTSSVFLAFGSDHLFVIFYQNNIYEILDTQKFEAYWMNHQKKWQGGVEIEKFKLVYNCTSNWKQ